ncbi:MAG TPA: helix-turn-helix transcriptional regulator [Jatrophihabitantaceae bacterium]|nr:helix-turn-helix transcriptional regulator [Jatrophihabitantaceae bacterium]
MLGSRPPSDFPPGTIAWLDITIDSSPSWPFHPRVGPLGLRIAPLDVSRGAFYFKGARLRGTRCLFGAVSLNGASLTRPARPPHADTDPALHLMIRGESSGSVFDGTSTLTRAVLKVIGPSAEIDEQFHSNSHLYTLNVHQATVGMEPASIAEMVGRNYPLTDFQLYLVRSQTQILRADADGLSSASAMVGVDRFLGSLAGLLLRTAVAPNAGADPVATVRAMTETIIFERATDPKLTPTAIAEELNISLRQLYRAFDDAESPAALIRRRRLEHAAEVLASRRTIGNVESVAQECGFASAEYFSRAFRREFGLSPRAYRSRYRDAPVSPSGGVR